MYNFECDWLIELSDNKLFDNNLEGELITIEKIVTFMINFTFIFCQKGWSLQSLLKFTAPVNFFYNLINNIFLKELLQSEKVIQALKAHQKKVKENKIKEMQERKVKKEQEPPKEATDQGKILACLTL